MILSEAIPGQAGQGDLGDWKGFSHVFICSSVADAQRWCGVHQRKSSFPDPGKLLFLFVGMVPGKELILGMAGSVKNKKVVLLMPDDLLGRIADVKIAVWLRGKEVLVSYLAGGLVRFVFRGKTFLLDEQKVSLNAFELACGFRSKIRTYKVRA